MKNNTIVYFVEGETEAKFLKSKLKNAKNKDGIISNGKVHCFNPYNEKNIRRILRHFSKVHTVVLVIDTDIKTNMNFDNNINEISKKSKKLLLLKQKDNFEDEICFCANISERELLRTYDAANVEEFKTKYLKSNTLLCSKIQGFDLEKYCSRYHTQQNRKFKIIHFVDLFTN